MKTFILYCAHRARRQRASAAISSHVSGCRIGLTNRGMPRVSGLSALCSHGCILRMTAWPVSLREGAAATYCSQESQAMSACAPECTCGSAWTGILRIRAAQHSCPSDATSVLESRNSFGCIGRTFSERGHVYRRSSELFRTAQALWCQGSESPFWDATFFLGLSSLAPHRQPFGIHIRFLRRGGSAVSFVMRKADSPGRIRCDGDVDSQAAARE